MFWWIPQAKWKKIGKNLLVPFADYPNSLLAYTIYIYDIIYIYIYAWICMVNYKKSVVPISVAKNSGRTATCYPPIGIFTSFTHFWIVRSLDDKWNWKVKTTSNPKTCKHDFSFRGDSAVLCWQFFYPGIENSTNIRHASHTSIHNNLPWSSASVTPPKKASHNRHWRPGQDCLLHSVPDASTWAPHHQLHHGPFMWIFFTRFWMALHQGFRWIWDILHHINCFDWIAKNKICSRLRCFREWEGKKGNIIHWITDEMKKKQCHPHAAEFTWRNPLKKPSPNARNKSFESFNQAWLEDYYQAPKGLCFKHKKSTATSYQLPIHQSTVVSWGPVVFFVGWLFWLNGPRKNSAGLLSRFH